MRMKAQNPVGSHAYFYEPYTVQHFTDFLKDRAHMLFVEIPQYLWEIRSKASREKLNQEFNRMMFGWVPDDQVMVFDNSLEGVHPMTANERQRWLGQ